MSEITREWLDDLIDEAHEQMGKDITIVCVPEQYRQLKESLAPLLDDSELMPK